MGGSDIRGEYITGKLFQDGRIVHNAILAFSDGRVKYAGAANGFDPSGWVRGPAFDGVTILPGLIDLHCHGAFGGDFANGDTGLARQAIDFLHHSGTTTFLASLVTASRQSLLAGIESLVDLVCEGLVAGIHLEGPFLSEFRCGAQNPKWIQNPDHHLAEELLAAGRGRIATMTYAPELPGATELVDLLTAHNVIPSLGHTNCDAQTAVRSLTQARDGLIAGNIRERPTVTHLFNGMPPLHHRSPGPGMASLGIAKAGKAVVELIADGTHLAPQTVRTVFELVGADNIALVTDSIAAAGLRDGKYMLGSSKVTVKDSISTLDANGSIAGGTATMLDVLRHTATAGVPIEDAITAATTVPASVLGLDNEIGNLHSGMRADARCHCQRQS